MGLGGGMTASCPREPRASSRSHRQLSRGKPRSRDPRLTHGRPPGHAGALLKRWRRSSPVKGGGPSLGLGNGLSLGQKIRESSNSWTSEGTSKGPSCPTLPAMSRDVFN